MAGGEDGLDSEHGKERRLSRWAQMEGGGLMTWWKLSDVFLSIVIFSVNSEAKSSAQSEDDKCV